MVSRNIKSRSGFEARVQLDLIFRGVSYRYQSVTIPYYKEHRYTPDIVLTNGILVELKGYLTATDRSKHLLVRKQHPELDIRFVFQNASKRLNKNSETTYGSWCDRHDIQWTEKHIPQEWIDEPPKETHDNAIF